MEMKVKEKYSKNERNWSLDCEIMDYAFDLDAEREREYLCDV